MFFRRDGLEHEFLPPALEIEEAPASPLGRTVIWLIALVCVSAIGWAYAGRVDQVAVARGKVVPDGEAKVLQPMREGVIRAIHVREGDRVRKGQLLVELDPTLNEADMEKNLRVFSLYRSDKDRLLAELRGSRLDPPPADGRDRPAGAEVRGLQETLKQAKELEFRAREDALRMALAQRESELKEAEATLAKHERVVPILREEEQTYRRLQGEGIVPRIEVLSRQKELYRAEHELEAQQMVVRQKREGIDEARGNLAALQKERQRGILSSLVEMEKSLATVEGELAKARKEREFDRLVSPVDGRVHELGSHTLGGVVKPAQALVSIVPDSTPLVVEAQALNSDVGFLRAGQKAEVKIDTFPFQKYGTLPGTLVSISPDAVEDPKLGHVYTVRASLGATSLDVDGARVALAPGMTASLEIKTGRRRIIEFFLSPIVKYANESLTLR